jgi:hypothetical protein
MLELAAINYALRKAGRDPAADIGSLNPQAANAKATLERVRLEVLETGFRFNSREITLAVNTANRVPISEDYLDVIYPNDFLISQTDTSDGERYVWNQQTHTWHTEAVQFVRVVFDIPEFTHLPHKFATWIARQAASEYWSEVNSGKTSPDQIRLEAAEARQKALNSEPLPNIRENTLWNRRRRAFQRRPSDRSVPYYSG